MTPTDRAARLFELADALVRGREEIARADTRDNGSPYRDLLRDVDLGAAWLRYYAGLASQTKGETMPTGHGRLNYTLREPFGVVGRIVPFNHPVLFATMKIAAPLAAGNTVVLKPSEYTSFATLVLANEFERIFPPGVVNVVTGFGAEAGDALVVHPLVRRLAFIGSESTGRRIQARAAEAAVKTISLELGGKNPIVVFPDADLDQAVAGVVAGMNFTFQGQSCGSTSRLIVHKDIHRDFVAQLVDATSSLRVGDPFDDETDVGTLINDQQLTKVLSYVELGIEEGAELVNGGTRASDARLSKGFFVRPGVFDHVRPDMRLAQEEIFGPILAVLEFETYDEAVKIGNSVRFGLTASVFTKDLNTAHKFARDVEAGFVWINDSARHFLGAPFGGYKDSGVGRDEDTEELLSYTQVKNVNVSFE
jgi:betaine-aldehyde dehydrogenase